MSDDLESMSDEQLDSLLSSARSQQVPHQNQQISGSVEPNLEGMSDAQLDELLAQSRQPKSSYGDDAADIAAGVGRGLFGAQDLASLTAAGLSYTPFHPKYVPTEGTFGERFGAAKRAQEKAAEKSFERSPWLSGAGTAAGIVASAPIFELAAPAEAALAGRTAGLASKAPLTAEVAGQAAKGAYQGAAYGATEGSTLDERLKNAQAGLTTGGILGGAIGPIGSRVLGYSPLTEAEKAAERMTKASSTDARIPAVVASPNPVTKGMTEAIKVAPFAKDVAQTAREEGQVALDKALMERGQFTPGVDLTRAGEATKSSIQDWMQNINPEQSNKMWERLKTTLGTRANVVRHPLTETENYIARHLPQLRRLNLPREELQKMLERVQNPTTSRSIPRAFKDIRAIQKYVGDKMHADFFQTGIKDQVLDGLYASLSQDARNAAEALGGQRGLQHYKAALASTKAAYDRQAVLRPILGANFRNEGTTIYSKILSAAENKPELVKQAGMILRRADPAGWKDITSRAAEQLGRTKDNQVWTPEQFVKSYGRLSKEGKRVLFGDVESEQRKALEDVAKASGAYIKSAKSHQYSKLMFATLGGLASALGLATHGTTGLIAPTTAAYVMSHVLSYPRLAHSWARVLENPTYGRINNFRKLTLAYVYGNSAEDNYSVTTMDDRTQRADGGKVGNRDYPAKRLTRVERALKRAQDAIALETKPIMNMQDEQVAAALRIAEKK